MVKISDCESGDTGSIPVLHPGKINMKELIESLIRENEFSPKPIYSRRSDSIRFFLKDESYISRIVNPNVMVYENEKKEVIGFKILGASILKE